MSSRKSNHNSGDSLTFPQIPKIIDYLGMKNGLAMRNRYNYERKEN